jgi:hypothetical protein
MVPEVDCPLLPSKCNFNTGNHVIVTILTHRYTVITEHEVFLQQGLLSKPTWDYNIKMTLYMMMQALKLILNPEAELLSS